MSTIQEQLAADLESRRAEHLYRQRRVVDAYEGSEVIVDGRRLINFCSNDYLGLAGDARLIKAMQDGAEKYGVGSGAAHLVTGHGISHHALEEELAEFVGYPRALLFSTGYMANLGVLSALFGQGDAVFEDRLNHASLLDAGLLSRARLKRYAHADVAALNKNLAASKARRKLVVSDGVFSMDGDIAPVKAMSAACKQHEALLMIDDAHGLGVIGEQGRGTLEAQGLGAKDVDLLVGTLGKGFGSFGAFVAGSELLIETLIQKARSYIYTTALPPAVSEATRASLKIIKEESWRREKLQQLIARFRSGAEQLGLKLMDSPTPIQPLLVGNAETALQISDALLERGLLISAIRPPTVPEGTARLRITFSAAHSEEQIERLLAALSEINEA